MTVIESAADIPRVAPDMVIVPEHAAVESTRSKGLLRLRSLCIGTALGLATLGITHPEPAEDYARLTQANIEHLVEEAIDDSPPDPKSFDYLERYQVSNGLFMDQTIGNYAQIWPTSQALSALHIMSLIPGHEAEFGDKFRFSLGATNKYWGNGPFAKMPGYGTTPESSLVGEEERFVDDNLWMGLIHIQEFEASNNPSDLEKAKQIFDLAWQQWDGQKGGIYWQVQWPGVQDRTRALVSNAPAVRLGVALYKQTGDNYYWSAAKEIFGWMTQLADDEGSLYHDHVKEDETVGINKYTYGQAVAADAMAAMSEIDPVTYPLQDAVDLANLSLDQLGEGGLLGNPAFDAIFYRVVFGIASKYDNPEFSAKIKQALGDTIADLPTQPTGLLDAAGIKQLIAIQSVPPAAYSKLF